MKSKPFAIASTISAAGFLIILSVGLVLVGIGPVQLSETLWVTSGHWHWLVFFDGISIEHEEAPFFGGTITLGDGDDMILANGVRTQPVTDRCWHLGWDLGMLKKRYVDKSGVTQLETVDVRLPGAFSLNYQ